MKKEEAPTYRAYPDFQQRLRALQQAKQQELDAVRVAIKAGEFLDEAATKESIEQKYTLLMAQAHLEYEVPVLQRWAQALTTDGQAVYHDERARTPMQPQTRHEARMHFRGKAGIDLMIQTTIQLPIQAEDIEETLDRYGLHPATWEARTKTDAPISPDVSAEQVQAAIQELLALGYVDITDQVRVYYDEGNFPSLRVFRLPGEQSEPCYVDNAAQLFREVRRARARQAPQA